MHLKGAPEVERRMGVGCEEGAVPPPRKFCISYNKIVIFLCIPRDIYRHCNCKPLREKINPRMVAENQQLYFCRFYAYCCSYRRHELN